MSHTFTPRSQFHLSATSSYSQLLLALHPFQGSTTTRLICQPIFPAPFLHKALMASGYLHTFSSRQTERLCHSHLTPVAPLQIILPNPAHPNTSASLPESSSGQLRANIFTRSDWLAHKTHPCFTGKRLLLAACPSGRDDFHPTSRLWAFSASIRSRLGTPDTASRSRAAPSRTDGAYPPHTSRTAALRCFKGFLL